MALKGGPDAPAKTFQRARKDNHFRICHILKIECLIILSGPSQATASGRTEIMRSRKRTSLQRPNRPFVQHVSFFSHLLFLLPLTIKSPFLLDYYAILVCYRSKLAFVRPATPTTIFNWFANGDRRAFVSGKTIPHSAVFKAQCK